MQIKILKSRTHQILFRVWESVYESIGWTVKTPIKRKWSWKYFRWFYEMEVQEGKNKIVKVFINNRSKYNTKKMTFQYRHNDGTFYQKVFYVNPKTFNFNLEFKKWCKTI